MPDSTSAGTNGLFDMNTRTETIDRDAAVNFRNALIRIIRRALRLPEPQVVPMAEELARAFAAEMGGLYIPKREIVASRDEAIRRDFNGRNHFEVMKKHGVSQRTLYRVIKGK